MLGDIDTNTLPKPEAESTTSKDESEKHEQKVKGPPPMSSLLNMDDVEEVATRQMSEKGWAYYYSAGDDLWSKTNNNAVYKQILLRPRIFVDCKDCDLTTNILGYKMKLPIVVSPAAMARLAHPEGEHGIAKACEKIGGMQIISNNASMTPEQIVQGAGPDQVFGWQLYVQTDAKKSEKMLERINKLDAIKFVCLTLDAPVPGKREHDERGKNVITESIKRDGGQEIPGAGGIGQSLFFGTDPTLTWTRTLPWLAKHTKKPIVLKGIQTHEDAYLAAKHAPQIRGIILSNHGGRAADTAPPAVHTLLEIRKYCPEVFSAVDVLVDGGIKRGTDVVKALALGAKAVGVGRAALWGLGAGGVEGVQRVLEILRDETSTAMRLLGAQKIDQLGPRHINTRAAERDIFDGGAGPELTAVGQVSLWAKSKL